jgi:hypothetical protein
MALNEKGEEVLQPGETSQDGKFLNDLPYPINLDSRESVRVTAKGRNSASNNRNQEAS